MKVILIKDVKNIGRAGDFKDVNDGYARNFLLPKGLAEVATDGVMKRVARNKANEEKQQSGKEKEMRELANDIEGKKVIIKVKAKDGKLFGSISEKNVAKELKKLDSRITEKMFSLGGPIKELGEKKLSLELFSGINAKVVIAVEGE
ncbi:50S ribosomal protein L9 [Patescibacteria group bacterium]